MTYLPAGLPAPGANHLTSPFWEAAKRHRIELPYCVGCEHLQWEPEVQCSQCYGADFSWREVHGTGTVFSWTRVWHPVHPALKDHGPYLVVVVRLDQAPGVRLVGNLLGDSNQTVTIGMSVRAVFQDSEAEGPTLIQWEAA